MTDIILFDFENHSIRFVGTAENPWWVAGDICAALGLDDVSQAVSTLKANESDTTNVRIRSENGVEQDRQVLIVNEPGLYRLIFKSRKAAAERMKDWVFSVVLPSIRKTGSYSIKSAPLQLPCHEVAVQKARAIREITDTLDDNPRLAQLLIDHTINDLIDSRQIAPSSEPPLRGVTEIALDMGYKTDHSSRVKLGNFVKATGRHKSVTEKRLCNGANRDINCYSDTPEVRATIKEFFS